MRNLHTLLSAYTTRSNMAATEGAHLGTLEKLIGDGYITPGPKIVLVERF